MSHYKKILFIIFLISTKSFASESFLIDKKFYELFPGKNIEYLVDSRDDLSIEKKKKILTGLDQHPIY